MGRVIGDLFREWDRGGVVEVDVSVVDREAARILASLRPLSVDDVEAAVAGRVLGGVGESAGRGLVRPRYELDGTRRLDHP